MKNKKTILTVGIVVGLLLGTYFIFKGMKKDNQQGGNNGGLGVGGGSSNTGGGNNTQPNTNTNTNTNSTKRAVVIDGVNIRVSPSTSSSVVRIATKGETFTILEQSGTWYRVAQGWITAKPEFVKTI